VLGWWRIGSGGAVQEKVVTIELLVRGRHFYKKFNQSVINSSSLISDLSISVL
jgi:hypothetical protein